MTFKDDRSDREFINLMRYIEDIKDYDDLRVANRKLFKMEQVYKFNVENFIQYYEYEEGMRDSSDEEIDDEEEDKHREFGD